MKISVIIPTFNEEKAISDCLSSLLSQKNVDIEITVVDDGSTDNTKEIVSKFPVSLISQSHKGAGAARNLGVKSSSGDILVFVDADMVFDSDFIEKLIQLIVENGEVGTFSSEEFVLNKDNDWSQCWNLNRGLPRDRMHGDNYPKTQSVFRAITKQKFLESGGFDETAGYTDDWSIADKIGVKATVALGARFYHRNPDTLAEVFTQARWMAKRKYKLGLLGTALALVRRIFPISIATGITKAVYYRLPAFFIFKIVSDFGELIGILEYVLFKRVAK